LGQQAADLLGGETGGQEAEEQEQLEEGLRAGTLQRQPGDTLAVHHLGMGHLLHRGVAHGRVRAEGLDVQQTSIGRKGQLPQGGQIAQAFAWLVAHGAVPVAYGDGLAECLRAAAPHGIDAFIDLFGPDYVQLAADLGVPRDRIETVISFQKAQELGTKAEGSASASTTEVLAELANLVASGAIEIPIAATYPLARVADAFAELEQRHTRGKIVLIP
jgi:threonine dehydrogenase-like Zn-dependent dehydrogenase